MCNSHNKNESKVYHAMPSGYDCFVNLHVHTSEGSLLDGLSKTKDVFSKVKNIKQSAVAISEHGTLFSAIKAHKIAKNESIKHIYAMEAYITENRFVKNKENKYYHLTILAYNEEGRVNLNKLSSLGYLESHFYFKPRIDHELLEQHKNGLIILSGCLAGEVQKAITQGRYDEGDFKITEDGINKAKSIAKWYQSIFGENYYMEVQAHRDERQQAVNRVIVDIAKELNIRYVATTDSHYTNEEDKELHDIFIQIGTNREAGETYEDCYIMTSQEVYDRLPSLTEEEREQAIKESVLIADRCNVQIPLSTAIIPHTELPKGFDSELQYLKHFINDGWKKRGIHKKSPEDRKVYKERLLYEMNAIEKMGFEGYFLFVESYANSVRRRGIARGSGGGSLIAYLMYITNIDPIPYNLYFERFIDVSALDQLEDGTITHKELKLPDFDLDFAKSERHLVEDVIIRNYSKDRYASLGQFGLIWDKSAIKDVGKVLGIPYSETDIMSKQLGDLTIEFAREAGLMKEWFNKYPKLFEYAEKLAGTPKSFGVHPCFAKGTMIKTNIGYKAIEDIQVGDYVLTHNNRYEEVYDTMINESNDIYELKAMGTEKITTTNNHPFYARKKLKQKTYSNPEWIKVEDLNRGDLLGIPINTNSIIPNFENIDTANPDFWWLAGRFLGDGWATKIKGRNETRVEICCSKKNNDLSVILERYKKLSFNYRITEKETSFNFISGDKNLYNFFTNFGKYAHGKKIPEFILDLPNNLLEEFINGYLSSDGYYNKGNQRWQISTVSKELSLGFSKIIHKLYGTLVTVTTRESKKQMIEGREVNCKKRYTMEFKKEKSTLDKTFVEDGYLWVLVSKNKKVERTEIVYNFSVKNDESYTVENVSVHNCARVAFNKDIQWHIPTAINNGTVVIQGDMYDAEDVGATKTDILGLNSLDVIYDTIDMVDDIDDEFINPDTIDFEDEKVLDLFRQGKTSGIFQFELEIGSLVVVTLLD